MPGGASCLHLTSLVLKDPIFAWDQPLQFCISAGGRHLFGTSQKEITYLKTTIAA
jgi:hypothetical protein